MIHPDGSFWNETRTDGPSEIWRHGGETYRIDDKGNEVIIRFDGTIIMSSKVRIGASTFVFPRETL